MSVKIIVAVAQNGVIGKDGSIPWRISADLKRFSELTKGNGKNAVIMGRKTWESIPAKYRPLPGRMNLVVTSSAIRSEHERCGYVPTLLEAFKLASDYEDVWLIGGQRIYEEAMATFGRTDGYRVEQVYLTLVYRNFEGDTFFPFFDRDAFEGVVKGGGRKDGLEYTFMCFDRKDS